MNKLLFTVILPGALALASRFANAEPRCKVAHVELHVVEDPTNYMRGVQDLIRADMRRGELKENAIGLHEEHTVGYQNYLYSISARERRVLELYLARVADVAPALKLAPDHGVEFERERFDNCPECVSYVAYVVASAALLDEHALQPVATVSSRHVPGSGQTTTWYVTAMLTADGAVTWRRLNQRAAKLPGQVLLYVDGAIAGYLYVGGASAGAGNTLTIFVRSRDEGEKLVRRLAGDC
jgi:hypothetical protein